MQSWRKKDGYLVHDGDCHFWSLKICTCGLLHYLLPRYATEDFKIYPNFWNDFGEQEELLNQLREKPREC